jgi:DNA-binding GntR family transcriptional regulator
MRRDNLPTGNRIYAAVKQQLLSGAFRPGERLDAARMAEWHAASITPVRAALHRLVGEGLVVTESGEGFHTPGVSEASLRDLYAWNGRCLQSAWQLAASQGPAADAVLGQAAADLAADLDPAAGASSMFAAIARVRQRAMLGRHRDPQ